jgi:phosphatidylglycerol:prolipoprotein diacylglycerol transferase
VHPTFFTIPGTEITVQSYGAFVGLALILGWIISIRFARVDKLPADRMGTAYVLTVGCGLFGARALWLMQHPEHYEGLASMVTLQAGGMSVGGGLLLGIGVSLAYCARRAVPFWAWADSAAPALLIGVALERLGAFLAGTDFGVYVDPSFALGITFPVDSPAYLYQRRIMTGMRFPPDSSLPVHPVQLYALLMALVGFGAALWIRAKRTFSGQTALFVLGFYSVARMAVEDPFRVDSSPEVLGPVTIGHVAAFSIAAASIAIYVSRKGRAQKDPTVMRLWTGGPWTPKQEE